MATIIKTAIQIMIAFHFILPILGIFCIIGIIKLLVKDGAKAAIKATIAIAIIILIGVICYIVG